MSTQTQPRVAAGPTNAGEFAAIVRPQTLTLDKPVIADVFATEEMVAEFAAIDFDLADSTAPFCAIATDATQSLDVRRTAARSAIERADDYVLHARHALSDDGTGVAGIAAEASDDDMVLDAAMSMYLLEEREPGDEHLFGIDMAALVYSCDLAANADSWGRRYRDETAGFGSETDFGAYEPNDPKGLDMDDLLERADLARG